MPFVKAIKQQRKLRMAIDGPAGSGKTMTALKLAEAIARAQGGRVALVDTEHASASLYADKFDFDVLVLETFSPGNYVQAIKEAEQGGYVVLIIDSLSHAWAGKGGALEMVDQAAKRSQSGSGNTFGAWRDVTPQHNALVETMLGCKMHLIVTLRSKMAYSMEEDPKTHRTTVRKVGMAPIQREGMEYEFDVVGDMNLDHDLIVSKTRCDVLADKVFPRPGEELANVILDWLSAGESTQTRQPVTQPASVPAPAPSDAEQPQQSSRTTPAARLPVYVALQIGDKQYQVPKEFELLEERDHHDYAFWVEKIWAAKDVQALGEIAKDLRDQAAILPEPVYQQLVRVGQARKKKLMEAADGKAA